MKALLVKELRQYAAFLILPIVVLLNTVFDEDLGERFLAPDLHRQLTNALLVPTFAAALLGFAQIVREEKHGTLSYLVHRELGGRALIGAKAAAGLALVAALAFGPPVACYAVARAFSPLRDVVQPMRLVEELCLATAAFAGYGAGVLAATLRGRLRARGAVALVGACGVLTLSAIWMAADPMPPALELVLFPLTSVLACLALLAFAALEPLGRERAVRNPRAGIALPRVFALLVLLVPAAWFLTSVASGVLTLVARGSVHPIVAVRGPGLESRAARAAASPAPYRVLAQDERVDDFGWEVVQPVELLELGDARAVAALGNAGGLGARWMRLDEFLMPTASDSDSPERSFDPPPPGAAPTQVRRAWLDRGAGVVRLLRRRHPSAPTSRPKFELLAVAPAEGPLSPRTFSLNSALGNLSPQVVTTGLLDPESRRLYALRSEDEAPRLVPLALPEGDALVSWSLPALPFSTSGPHPAVDPVLRGERGDYVWRSGKFESLPEWAPALAGAPPATPWLSSDHDLLRPTRAVVAPDGAVLFRAEHEIHGARRTAEAAALALEFLRSPVVSALSYAGDDDPERVRGHIFRAPLLVGGRRGWLLGVHAGLALLLAALAWRRLGGRSASVPRAGAWALAIVAIGPVAFLVHVLCEPAVERRVGWARTPTLVLATEAARA
jgi:hypothetical protein